MKEKHYLHSEGNACQSSAPNTLNSHLLLCRFDFCSEKTMKRPSENLGQVLFGERIEPSPYKVTHIYSHTYTRCHHSRNKSQKKTTYSLIKSDPLPKYIHSCCCCVTLLLLHPSASVTFPATWFKAMLMIFYFYFN